MFPPRDKYFLSFRLAPKINERLKSFDISKSYTSSKETYTVKRGEYLYLIGKKFNVKVDEIKNSAESMTNI